MRAATSLALSVAFASSIACDPARPTAEAGNLGGPPTVGGDPVGRVAGIAQPIIDGAPAPELTGVVHVRHPLSDLLCSGVVIAPTLVVTAKHCAFREIDPTDEPLRADGFSVGFGPDVESLTLREVGRLAWVGAPDEVDVQTAIDAGEDVVVLVLTEPVPPGTHIHPVELDYTPALDHEYAIAGYGLSSLDTWDSGTKRVATDAFHGYDAPTGIIQLEGNGACNGDSGGPVLYGADQALVGVISQIGGTDTGEFCTVGATFASTVRNDRVRELLEAELAALPPCEDREEVCDNGQDENCDDVADEGCSMGGAGGAGGAAAVAGNGPTTHGGEAGDGSAIGAGGDSPPTNAGGPNDRARAGSGNDDAHAGGDSGCGCRTHRRSAPTPFTLVVLAVAVAALWRRRR